MKTKCDTDKSELEKKIPDIRGLVKKADYNAKISEKKKKPTVCGLATNFALAAVENKLPNISSRKKTKKQKKQIVI